MPDFDQPLWLCGLLLAALPWFYSGQQRVPWASVAALPADPASRAVDLALRGCASVALAAAVLSLSGTHVQGRPIERIGTGAHVVITLDRSASMADTFANQSAGDGEESKGQAASRLLDAFVRERPHDLFGFVSFSTAPVRVLGLSGDNAAVRAAIAAAASPDVGLTNIAAALTMALESFRDQPHTGSRVILLVSDGAASVDARAQLRIRSLFQEYQAQLYWVFLRSDHGNSPVRLPTPDAGSDVAPEFYLNLFFRDLGVGYRLYEAETPQALASAIADVSRLQNLPLRYLEVRPRFDFAPWCDALALACILAWVLARCVEVPRWQA
jgi:mxaC protein